MAKFCSECGEKLSNEHLKYCSRCGKNIHEEQSSHFPLYIAVVVERFENGEVHLRMPGNKQEFIRSTNSDLWKELKPGTKVAVNNTLSIVRIVKPAKDTKISDLPLFIAVVVDILENGEVHLRLLGNNQECISSANNEILKELKPGTKVAVDNALSIVRIVKPVKDSNHT